MQIWIISDTHFSHQREFLYKPRGFTTITEMNEAIVENWNNKVKSEDLIFHLGDLCLSDNKDAIKYIKQLNGTIKWIRGNHDGVNRVLEIQEACSNIHLIGDMNTSWASLEKIKGYSLYLSHYPTMVGSLEDMSPLNKRLINLHGHLHSKNKFYQDIPFMYNVALDAHNNAPVSFDKIISDIEAKAKECIAML